MTLFGFGKLQISPFFWYNFEISPTHTTFRLLLITLSFTLLLIPGRTQADIFAIPQAPPRTFGEIQTMVTETIPQALEQGSQCGGWIAGASVGTVPGEGMIAKVTGVPGWEGEPLGLPKSGMAKRIEQDPAGENGFVFPSTTQGLTTACDPGTQSVTRTVWEDRPEGGAYVQKSVPNPLFTDSPCRWDESGEHDPQTPESCVNFCLWVNSFTYDDCREFENILDDEGNAIGKRCTRREPKYTCTEEWRTPAPQTVALKNCEICTGDRCRCPGPGCSTLIAKSTERDPPSAGREQKTYRSFFRKYTAQTNRSALPAPALPAAQSVIIPEDKLQSITARVACYGFYDEFDPKTRAVDNGKDRRCVIDFPYTREELQKSQAARMTFQSAAALTETDPLVRQSATPGTDPWYVNLGGAFSLLKENVFAQKLGRSIVRAFLEPDAAVIVSPARPGRLPPLAPDDTVSADDGGLPFFSRWWRSFQEDLSRLGTPPAVRLRLPSFLSDIASAVPADGEAEEDREHGTIEVQVRAEKDLIGQIADALERALLQIREEPLYVVVPLLSQAEIGGKIEQWEDYKRQREAFTLPVPPEVDALIARLKEYREQIENIRRIRLELPRVLAGLLERQHDLALGIREWAVENETSYQRYRQSATLREVLAERGRALEREYAALREDASPWCKNELFTTPIYSLLDPWYPGRPNLQGGVPSCRQGYGLPMLCVPEGETDLTLDLSRLRLTRGALLLPVLHPVPVSLALPSPPRGDKVPTAASLVLPHLPPVPSLGNYAAAFPTIEKQPPLPYTLENPPAFDFGQANEAMDEAEKIISGMHGAYRRFWNGIEPSDKMRNLECTWGQEPCVYPETELLPSFTRFVSRPGVLLDEDLHPPTVTGGLPCDPAEEPCQQLLPQKTLPADGWQVVAPREGPMSGDPLETLRTTLRRQVIGDDGKMADDPETQKPYLYGSEEKDLAPIYRFIPSSY